MTLSCGLRTVSGVLGILLASSVAVSPVAGQELWFYNKTNLQVQANVDATKALIDRAAAAGYTRMMLSDTKLGYDGVSSTFNPSLHLPKLRSVIAYGDSKGVKVVPATFDVGRAQDWILGMVDKNLAEGQKVVGATYTVGAGNTLTFVPQNPTLNNTGFESSLSGTWAADSGRVTLDSAAGVAHGGSQALKLSAYTSGASVRGFAIQNMTVQPNKQYRVTFWAKTQSFNGDLLVKMYDSSAGRMREYHEGNSALSYAATQGWTQYQYVFNSAESTNLEFRVGSWGTTTGTAWFDDVKIEEVALHNLVRASGSPLKAYKADGTPLNETTQLNTIAEPAGLTYKINRTPLTPSLRDGHGLTIGDTVKIDYYAVQPVYNEQYGASLTEPAVNTYYRNVAHQLLTSFAPGTGFMLAGYDEIRHGNTSAGAKATGLSAGDLLGQSFKRTYDAVRAEDPTAPIYTWSDMFDPNHNAKDNFYLWDGNIAGSGNWLPDDVTIINWLRTNASLEYFSGLGNDQIIAGWYDGGNGYTAAQNEIQQAIGVSGVRGMMYTTWTNNYTQLENYAAGAKANWALVPEPGTLALLALGLPFLMRRPPNYPPTMKPFTSQ